MGRKRRLLAALVRWGAAASLAVAALAQTTAPTTAPALPADVRQALTGTVDFTFNFDEPGFYALLEHVATTPTPPGWNQRAVAVEDWTVLLERPSAFRGRPITITATLGRNKAPYILEEYPALGRIYQLELSTPEQPITMTVICTSDVSDVPLGASVTVTGYFLKIRKYYDSRNQEQLGGLIVAAGPTAIDRTVATPRETPEHTMWIILAVSAGLVLAVILLRRTTGHRRQARATDELRASRSAPVDLSTDLQQLIDDDQPPDDERRE